MFPPGRNLAERRTIISIPIGKLEAPMLETVDLKKAITKAAYTKRINELQEQLRRLQYEIKQSEIPVTLCLEGWDSSGKGTIIKKLTERLDPRLFKVHPGTPPNELERKYHFLWRYQIALPNDGEMAVFDHSWYSRVLVERCDKLTKKKDWNAAFQQISEFERWLADDGQIIVKFWLHISKKEQAKRFCADLKDPLRKWKITDEYKRHHKQYGKWTEAVEEMLSRTDTPHAPWTLVEATDTHWSRIRIFETLITRMEEALRRANENPLGVSRRQAASAARKAMQAKRKEQEHAMAQAEEKKAMAEPATELTHA